MQLQKLSDPLPRFTKNSKVVEFTLGSYALKYAVLEALQDTPHYLLEASHNSSFKTPELETAFAKSAESDFTLSLFAGSCYRNDIAEDITGALATFYNLEGQQVHNIHLCLHEAIINGVVHGNLSVPGIFKNKQMLADYYEWIEARLSVPALFNTRIHISSTLKADRIILEVIDQGRGYLHQNFLNNDIQLDSHQGLQLIQQSCHNVNVLGSGNHIRMEFVIS